MAIAHSFCAFETSLGWIAVGWNNAGIVRFQTPQSRRDDAVSRILRLNGGPAREIPEEGAPDFVIEAITLARRYANGEPVEFCGVALDLAGISDFEAAIYDAARKLRYGEVVTYGELAARAGHPGMARETGQALGANPVPVIIPCHRIVAASGKIGGFSAPGGSRTKEKLLSLEGAQFGPPPLAQASFSF